MTGLKNNTSIMHIRDILRDFRISKVRTTSLMHIILVLSEESSKLITTEWYFQSLNVQLYFWEFSSNTMETA